MYVSKICALLYHSSNCLKENPVIYQGPFGVGKESEELESERGKDGKYG